MKKRIKQGIKHLAQMKKIGPCPACAGRGRTGTGWCRACGATGRADEYRRYKSDGHQMETRIFAREIHESFCCQPKCRYFGKHAQQGVCHTRLRKSVVHDLERRF